MDADDAITLMMSLNPGLSREDAEARLRRMVRAVVRPTTIYMSKDKLRELRRLNAMPQQHQPRSVRGVGSHSVGTYRGPQQRKGRRR